MIIILKRLLRNCQGGEVLQTPLETRQHFCHPWKMNERIHKYHQIVLALVFKMILSVFHSRFNPEFNAVSWNPFWLIMLHTVLHTWLFRKKKVTICIETALLGSKSYISRKSGLFEPITNAAHFMQEHCSNCLRDMIRTISIVCLVSFWRIKDQTLWSCKISRKQSFRNATNSLSLFFGVTN